MSNIDKRALRQHAEHIIELEGDEAICHRVLIDAYEKSDQLFTAQNVMALLDELAFLDKRNAELNSTLERWAVDRAQSASELDDAEKRIAELEAKKVTIKLPESFYPDGDIDCPLVINEYQIIEAIVAADCKPIAVCPRCKCELDLTYKRLC